ncbi:hypothetical protein CSE45_4168 [Citreicella sp. SE45]|nr:hypothetical protein CSE45_4168 [Citreicella sp. SE45]
MSTACPHLHRRHLGRSPQESTTYCVVHKYFALQKMPPTGTIYGKGRGTTPSP